MNVLHKKMPVSSSDISPRIRRAGQSIKTGQILAKIRNSGIITVMEIQKVFILGLLSFSALVLAAGDSIEKWQVQDYWAKLEIKMTEQAAIELLGKPLEIETVKNYHIWYYQQPPQRQADAIVSRPRFGILRFRVNDSICLLLDWKEPDWTSTTPCTEAQYLAEQKRIEDEMEREQVRQEQERIAEERKAKQEQQKAEAERISTERKIARVKATEQAQQRRQEQITLRQNQLAKRQARQANPPQTKADSDGYTLKNNHTIYWFSAAGLFLVMAISISIVIGFKK